MLFPVFLDVVIDPVDTFLYDPVFQTIGIALGIIAVSTVTIILFAFGGKKK